MNYEYKRTFKNNEAPYETTPFVVDIPMGSVSEENASHGSAVVAALGDDAELVSVARVFRGNPFVTVKQKSTDKCISFLGRRI